MTTFRCPRLRSTRRDPLPHTLRFVRHRPWFFRFGALRLLHGLGVILGRLSKCYFFLLAFPSAACGVGALGVQVRWKYYEKISGRGLVRRLGRFVEGVASGRGFVACNSACPSAPSPPPGARYSVAQARPDSKESLSRRPSDPGCVLATGGASVSV